MYQKCFQKKFWIVHTESNESAKEIVQKTISVNQDSGNRCEEK